MTQVLPWRVEQFIDTLIKSGPRWIQEQAIMLRDTYSGEDNLEKAKAIITELDEVRAVQSELKRSFKHDELDGGWKSALSHPLYLEANEREQQLLEELKGLI